VKSNDLIVIEMLRDTECSVKYYNSGATFYANKTFKKGKRYIVSKDVPIQSAIDFLSYEFAKVYVVKPKSEMPMCA
jgi:hypothetical protein